MSGFAELLTRMRNVLRQEAKMAVSNIALPRDAIVKNYDPAHYAVRVEIQPEGILTGWIPVKSDWVGNGWGDYSPPSIGDVGEVQFIHGDKDRPSFGPRYFNDKTQPVPVGSGERLIMHQSGSFIHMTNDGDIVISAARDLILHGSNRYIFDANGQGQIWDGEGVETWQDNDVPKPHHVHAPPKIPS